MSQPIDPKTLFGINTKRLREQAGISTKDLAKKLGVASSYLSQIEAGLKGFTSDSVANMAEALGVEAWELLQDVNKSVSKVAEPSVAYVASDQAIFAQAAEILQAYGTAEPENRLVALAILKHDPTLVRGLPAVVLSAVEALSKDR